MSSSTDPREGPKVCRFNDCLDIWRELPLFSGVPLDVIKVLAYLSGAESFRAGEPLCEQGAPLDRCVFVRCGDLEVTRATAGGEAALQRLGPGSFFGGLGLLAPAKAAYTVRAATDADCLVLTREKFAKTAERFPDILPKILHNVVAHVFRWDEGFLSAHAGECAGRGGETGLSLF